MELDEKMLPLETQFANFGPVECVDLCIALQGRTQQLYRDGTRHRNMTGRDPGHHMSHFYSSHCLWAWGRGNGDLAFDPEFSIS